MYTIDIMLRGTPLSLSIQRKESADANATHRQIADAIQSGTPKLLELACEKDEGKKITVLVNEIVGVQISEKAGGSAAGKSTGFFGQLTAQVDTES